MPPLYCLHSHNRGVAERLAWALLLALLLLYAAVTSVASSTVSSWPVLLTQGWLYPGQTSPAAALPAAANQPQDRRLRTWGHSHMPPLEDVYLNWRLFNVSYSGGIYLTNFTILSVLKTTIIIYDKKKSAKKAPGIWKMMGIANFFTKFLLEFLVTF